MNTKIEYLYRDADNYKVWNQCVINGELSADQQKTILSCLSDGEYFIPSQVGLPEEKFDTYDEQSDHPWFELGEYSFQETHAQPTVDISANQLVRAFTRAKGRWDPDFTASSLPQSLASLIQSASDRSAKSKDPGKTIAARKVDAYFGR